MGSTGAKRFRITTAPTSKCKPDYFGTRKPTRFFSRGRRFSFSEYWMPVRGIGGISRANLAGVVNLSRDGNKLKTAFNANRAIPGASIRILDGDRALLNQKVDLAPERTWSHEIDIPDAQKKYTFELRDAAGAVLLSQTEGKYDWTPKSEIHVGPQPSYHMPAADRRSEDDWIQLGKDQEQNGELLNARDTYEQALQKFPKSFDLGKAAGRLAASLLLYDEAVERLEPVQRRDTPDPEIAYYLGIAYSGLGETRKAITAFEAAQRLPSFHAAGTLKLGELHAREGDLKEAGAVSVRVVAQRAGRRTYSGRVGCRKARGRRSGLGAIAGEDLACQVSRQLLPSRRTG